MLWPGSGIYAARLDVDPPAGSPAIGDVKVIPMDFDYINGASGAVKKRFNEIFLS